MYNGSSNWILTHEKVNSGFTQTNKFNITIGNKFDFYITYEDQTKNAEKDAKYVTLSQTLIEGNGVMILLKLDKK